MSYTTGGASKSELNRAAIERWIGIESCDGISVETRGEALDKYEIANFARDDWPRFVELVAYLSPRDQEIMLLFAVLQKRPTDLSVLFGKAGHRAGTGPRLATGQRA